MIVTCFGNIGLLEPHYIFWVKGINQYDHTLPDVGVVLKRFCILIVTQKCDKSVYSKAKYVVLINKYEKKNSNDESKALLLYYMYLKSAGALIIHIAISFSFYFFAIFIGTKLKMCRHEQTNPLFFPCQAIWTCNMVTVTVESDCPFV